MDKVDLNNPAEVKKYLAKRHKEFLEDMLAKGETKYQKAYDELINKKNMKKTTIKLNLTKSSGKNVKTLEARIDRMQKTWEIDKVYKEASKLRTKLYKFKKEYLKKKSIEKLVKARNFLIVANKAASALWK